MEGVGRLQAEQTPQWIVGKERDVRSGEERYRQTCRPPHPMPEPTPTRPRPLQLAVVPGCDPTPLCYPARPCSPTHTVYPGARPWENTHTHTHTHSHVWASLFTLHAMPSL